MALYPKLTIQNAFENAVAGLLENHKNVKTFTPELIEELRTWLRPYFKGVPHPVLKSTLTHIQ